MSHTFNYETKEELYRYLNRVSYAIYGADHNSLLFLNGNRYDFSNGNVLINS